MKNLNELLLAVGLLVVLFLKLDPFHWFMPTATQMLLLVLFASAFSLYSGVIYREKARDERESLHLYRANRMGYLVGVVSISVVIVIQDIRHELDPYLLIILALMIVVKLITLLHARIKY